MAADLKIYPLDYDSFITNTGSSALDTAVKGLQTESRIQAIRLALSRRSACILAAAQQNSGAIMIGSLMPITVDPEIRNQSPTQTATSGTVGYVFGMGAGLVTDVSADRVTFATDAVTLLGGRTNFGRKQRGGASRLISGILAGGSSSRSGGNAGEGEIEEFSYTTETSTTLSGILPFTKLPFFGGYSGRRAPTGYSSPVHAYFVASYQGTFDNNICRVDFESKSTILLTSQCSGRFHHGAATSNASHAFIFGLFYRVPSEGISQFQFSTESVAFALPVSRDTTGASRQVLGNGVSAWVFGGRVANPTWNYRYSHQTNSYARIAANLPGAVVNAARIGSSSVGYLCGGSAGPYHIWNSWFTTAGFQSITKFTFATETLTATPNALSTPRSHGVGISNFSGAFA